MVTPMGQVFSDTLMVRHIIGLVIMVLMVVICLLTLHEPALFIQVVMSSLHPTKPCSM